MCNESKWHCWYCLESRSECRTLSVQDRRKTKTSWCSIRENKNRWQSVVDAMLWALAWEDKKFQIFGDFNPWRRYIGILNYLVTLLPDSLFKKTLKVHYLFEYKDYKWLETHNQRLETNIKGRLDVFAVHLKFWYSFMIIYFQYIDEKIAQLVKTLPDGSAQA